MDGLAGQRGVKTTCPYCGVGCGIVAEAAGSGGVAISGDADHPANRGRLCSKGAALGETLGLEGRLLYPMAAGQRISWNDALGTIAHRFQSTIAEHGPDSVAFYVSGQFLTEDYYVANKLMKGFIGSANIDTNSRLCMASSVAGHKRAFGSDTVPGTYEDIELADLVVLVGSNLAWCHPILFRRLMDAKAARPAMKLVVVDPRRTQTADAADLHLAVAPGSDVALFNGLLCHLYRQGRGDTEFVAQHTGGFADALAVAKDTDFDGALAATGLEPTALREFYDLFAATERTVTVFSQGVNQSSHGTDKVNAIVNCHLFTGRIGRPGMGPFSVTGQPNAMGGREVGGLANQLAAHMELDNCEHGRIVRDFWRAPTIAGKPGLKAVDLFRAVGEGKVKALWVAGTNPVDSLPDADAVRAALSTCPFVVVSDVVAHTDTTAFADLLLPAAAWGEKDGTVTNSERRISRQRAFLPPPGEAMPDWWMFAQVGRRMGWREAFDYGSPADIFAEHAALSGAENGGTRDFDISGLPDIRADYGSMAPFQWPVRPGEEGSHREINADSRRFFADGRFFTPDRRARFVPTPAQAPASAVDARFPLILNTGRIRDQWHTMTRSGRSPRLMAHLAEPFAEIHPDDAASYDVADASLVELSNAQAAIRVRALITDRQRRGSVFVPMHWNDQFASSARVDSLMLPNVDALSGQPELKFTPVSMRRYEAAWHGFAVTAERPARMPAQYWAMAPCTGGWRIELADRTAPTDWEEFARRLFVADSSEVDFLGFHDAHSGRYRFAAFQGQRLLAALFMSPEPVAVSRAWAAAQLSEDFSASPARVRLLAGRPGGALVEPGATVCSCFGVGLNQILGAVRQGCRTAEDIGGSLKAGTNCGSCVSEIRGILADVGRQTA
jgi:assimilatory nitrate reductase catalytic subunit